MGGDWSQVTKLMCDHMGTSARTRVSKWVRAARYMAAEVLQALTEPRYANIKETWLASPMFVLVSMYQFSLLRLGVKDKELDMPKNPSLLRQSGCTHLRQHLPRQPQREGEAVCRCRNRGL